MAKITYIRTQRHRRMSWTSPAPEPVMEGARDKRHSLAIEARLRGAVRASTAMLYVHPDWVAKLPGKKAMEEDMLDFGFEDPTRRARV